MIKKSILAFGLYSLLKLSSPHAGELPTTELTLNEMIDPYNNTRIKVEGVAVSDRILIVDRPVSNDAKDKDMRCYIWYMYDRTNYWSAYITVTNKLNPPEGLTKGLLQAKEDVETELVKDGGVDSVVRDLYKDQCGLLI